MKGNKNNIAGCFFMIMVLAFTCASPARAGEITVGPAYSIIASAESQRCFSTTTIRIETGKCDSIASLADKINDVLVTVHRQEVVNTIWEQNRQTLNRLKYHNGSTLLPNNTSLKIKLTWPLHRCHKSIFGVPAGQTIDTGNECKQEAKK
ncbi:hypothetical protein HQ571_05985 [Candidatus Kuenenbacteria bacterium]|nr:hypothetical protein [Candidatus Kuenenbacteria bacterium]